MSELRSLAWDFSQVGDALVALARESGLEPPPVRLPEPPRLDAAARDGWIESTARLLRMDAERLPMAYPEAERMLGSAGRLLVWMAPRDEGKFLVLLDGGVVLSPDLRRHRLGAAALRTAVCGDMEREASARIRPALERAGLSEREIRRAERALLSEQLAERWVAAWSFRMPVSAPWRKLAGERGWPGAVARLAAVHVARLVVFLLAWRVIGEAVLTGRIEMGWLAAWALLLLTVTPLHMTALWQQARLAVSFGALLKQRLLVGALRLEPETVLEHGAGQLLGKVIESAALENLALSGGFAGLVALLELAAAAVVLLAGGAYLTVAVLVVWLGATAWIGRRYWERARAWTQTRLDLTDALVERMVGHRTRLAQELPGRWHDAEDQEMSHYMARSRARDRAEVWLQTVAPQGWMVMGALSLGPSFLSDGASTVSLAVGLGGLLLAYGALRRLAAAAWQVIDASIAGEQVRLLASTAEQPELAGSPLHSSPSGSGTVEVQEAVFRYPDREEVVLRQCSLRVERGDRVVLEGPSGGGKSTLAAVLAGIRPPQSGLLMASGLDRATVGANAWRRRVALAPQFHQNHMITGPLSFNLLMSRPEPHGAKDVAEAEALCRELGLGPLLERMPGGIGQIVGETGWQLSQGERSRVFIARALLQGADLVILDENFGALDPETMRSAVECVMKRARSLVVVAHR